MSNRLTRPFAVLSMAGLLCLSLAAPAAAREALSLQDCIQFALQTNAAAKIAASNSDKAQWAIKEAQGAKNFSVSLTHVEKRYDPTLGVSDTYNNQFSNQAALTLPLYTGGKLEGKISQARHSADIASLALDNTRQQLVLDTTAAYYTVLQYRDALLVSQQTVDDYAEHLKNTQTKYDVGLVAKSDVLQTQVKLANAQDNLITAKNNYINAQSTLNNLIGRPQGQEISLSEDLTYEPRVATLDQCIQYALTHRPEVAQAQASIGSAKDQIQIARSGNLPTLSFSAANNWYDDKLPGSDNSNWQISLTASMNLFDSGVTKSQIRQAEHSFNATQEQSRQTRESVELEVRQLYNTLREAEARIELSKVTVAQAEEDLRIYKARYDAGVSTNLEVMDAAVSLTTAKNNAIKALYDYNSSKAKLDKAIGTPVKS